MSHDIGFDIDY